MSCGAVPHKLESMATAAAPIDPLFAELVASLGDAAAAAVEADRCLECGGPHAPAPCVVACPAGIDVPGFVTQLAAGDVDGRYRLTYMPEKIAPIEEWLRDQTHFAHLLKPDARPLVDEIQRQVEADWEALVERCELDTCNREA
jgi:hypothetical protein